MTTILTTIPIITTIPKKIITKIPSTLITTIPLVVPPTSIIQDVCKYGVLINYISSFSNLSNTDIYDYKIKNIINSYCLEGSGVLIKGQNANFQVTTTKNEINGINNNLSGLDLTECENTLKGIYHIDPEAKLIILKFMKDDGQTLKYEIYNPYTHEKLNLSYCENTTADVYVPITMDEKTEELYNNLKDQGYDPLN
jgi:hypothetical protein